MVEISPTGRKVIYHLGRCWGEGAMATNWIQQAGSVYWTSVEGISDTIEFVEQQDIHQRFRMVEMIPTEPGTAMHDRVAQRLYVWCSDGATPASHHVYWEYGNRPRDVGTVFDGPHAWNLDFTQPVKVAVDETHSGWAWSGSGSELFVSQNNRNDWIEACDLETGAIIQCLYQGDFGWGNGWHFARMPRITPGWILMSTYRTGTNTDWGDNQIFLLEMRDQSEQPRVWRLGPTHNTYDDYYAEGFATISQFGDRLWWGAKWPGQTNIEAYEMQLPPHWWIDLAHGPAFQNLAIRSGSPNQIELLWPSSTNKSYSVYTATNVNGPFQLLTNNLPALPPVNTFTWPRTADPSRFYRVAEEP
jgi:hypothetical protein